jgi:hypothetical protein
MTLAQAIQALYPLAIKIIGENAYDKDGNEIIYDKNEINSIIANNEYKNLRVAEYPNFLDYLDGIVKGDTAQQQVYIDACKAVKAKYPKPTGN